MPAGRDLALLGIGLRSNFDACQQLMDRDLLGTRRFAVVRDDFEQHQVRWRRSNWHGTACKLWFCCQLHNGTLHCPSPPPAGGLHHPSPPDPLQDRMHLDCVFSIVSDNVCIMLEEMMGEASPTRRLVDEYTRGSDGAYAVSRQGVEFSQYMQDNGYHIIPISAKHQLVSAHWALLGGCGGWRRLHDPNCHPTPSKHCAQEYGCNVLNLGNERIISVHMETARQIVQSPHFYGDVQCIDYSPITSMYGAVHCSSQVVKRAPRRF